MDEPEENEPQNRRINIEPFFEAANPDEEIHIGRLPGEILCIIFKYLNGRDLSRVAMSCRKLLAYANREKNLRGPYCFKTQYYISATEQFNFNCIAQSPIKPLIAFFFLPIIDYNIKDAIRNLLPTNCKTIVLFTHSSSLNKNLYVLEDNFCSYIVCALLPKISNVQLSMIKVPNIISESRHAEYTQMIETASRQNHESSICLMLFCNHFSNEVGRHMANIARLRLDNERVSFCGVMVRRLRHTSYNIHLSLSYGIALLITGSIQTWSVVLEKEKRELAERKLQLFKEQVQFQKHTVGFVFFSKKLLHDVQNRELKIFKELFPNVPLVGCSGDNEFGKDTGTYGAEYLGPQSGEWYKKSSITFMILTYD